MEPQYRNFDTRAKNKMLTIASSIANKVIMKNHIYRFEGKIEKKQSKGSPIGLDLTGDMAKILMMWRDQEFLRSQRRPRHGATESCG